MAEEDINEEEVDELDDDFDGGVEDLDDSDLPEVEDLDDDDVEEVNFDTNSDDYIESNYEEAVRANPKRKSMLKKRARQIEGILDGAELESPDGIEKAWARLNEEANTKVTRDYNIKEAYGENDVVKHPKFGAGFVIEILSPSKMAVLFEDGIKRLAMNKG